MFARRPRLIRPGLIEEPGRRLGTPPRVLRFLFRFIDDSPYAAFVLYLETLPSQFVLLNCITFTW